MCTDSVRHTAYDYDIRMLKNENKNDVHLKTDSLSEATRHAHDVSVTHRTRSYFPCCTLSFSAVRSLGLKFVFVFDNVFSGQ